MDESSVLAGFPVVMGEARLTGRILASGISHSGWLSRSGISVWGSAGAIEGIAGIGENVKLSGAEVV